MRPPSGRSAMTVSTDARIAVEAAAARLTTASRTGVPCSPVRDLIGADAVDLAYAVQLELTTARLAAGARIVGHKIGLTSPAVQAQLGVDRPDFGVLFDDMQVAVTGEPVDITRLLQPRIEAEIAFVLAADITGPEVTVDEARAAVAYATPALEIVDSRISSWDISFADTVADNASSGLYVLGAAQRPLDAFEPVEATMSMTRDGEVVSSGSGDACLGDPLNALVWLAATAIAVGSPLRAGDVVLSGALGPMVAVSPGSTYGAEIDGLGVVEATFTERADA